MKANLHPVYNQATVTCSCGNSFVVGSTLKSLQVDICSKCHPFFTGDHKFIDALGRVDKFMAKREKAGGYVAPKKANKRGAQAAEAKRLSLKEMLTVTKTSK